MFVLFLCGLFSLFAICKSSDTGWTYKSTSSVCNGTASNPCPIDSWETVSPLCTGIAQSPISFSQFSHIDSQRMLPIINSTDCNTWTMASEEAGLVVKFERCNNMTVKYMNNLYRLRHMHFRSPSEHTIGGGYYSAEIQLIHERIEAGNNKILAMSVLLQASSSSYIEMNNNDALSMFWNGSDHRPLNPYHTLLPGNQAHYAYNGSLTYPPCTENVQWVVYHDTVPISTADFLRIRASNAAHDHSVVSLSGSNNRTPPQPLHNRTVYYVPGVGASKCCTTATPPSRVEKDDDISSMLPLTTAAASSEQPSWYIITTLLLSICALVSSTTLCVRTCQLEARIHHDVHQRYQEMFHATYWASVSTVPGGESVQLDTSKEDTAGYKVEDVYSSSLDSLE